VCDRIVQTAAKAVIEPIFEADFEPCSFGFRPGRTARDALRLILDECFRGRRWVVETDIANRFEAIPQERLMRAVEERIVDRQLLKLLRALLRAGVTEEGAVRRSVSGTPRGGVILPLFLQRLPAPARSGLADTRAGPARRLRRRSGRDLQNGDGGPTRPCGAAGAALGAWA
jgi:RNA-directed DNA polymerase